MQTLQNNSHYSKRKLLFFNLPGMKRIVEKTTRIHNLIARLETFYVIVSKHRQTFSN